MRVFFVGVVAVFLTYSINSRESFDNLDVWLQEARDKANEDAIVILVGNKCDLERNVAYEEGIEYMKKNKLDVFFETSAKNGENVNKVRSAYLDIRRGRSSYSDERKDQQEEQ